MTSGENEEGEPREPNRSEVAGFAFFSRGRGRRRVCGAPVNAAAASRARRSVGRPSRRVRSAPSFAVRGRRTPECAKTRSRSNHLSATTTSERLGQWRFGRDVHHGANDERTSAEKKTSRTHTGRRLHANKPTRWEREESGRWRPVRYGNGVCARREGKTRVARGYGSSRKNALARSLDAPLQWSGRAVPRSRFALISLVCSPYARSIFLLKCSLRSLMCVTSRSS